MSAPRVSELVDELVVLLIALRIHGDSAEESLEAARAPARTLERLLAVGARERLELRFERGLLTHDGRALVGASLGAAHLVEALERLGAGGLALERGADADALLALARRLERRDAPADDTPRARLLPTDAPCAPGVVHDLERPLRFYQRLVDHLQDVMVRVCRRESVSLGPTRMLVDALVARVEREPGELLALARYESHEAFTFGHSLRVTLLALEFAQAHTHDRATLERLALAALVHDIGKAWVPFEVLHTRGPLDDAARAEMERHTEYGGAILTAMEADPLCVAVAFGHHLRFAGGGYPRTRHTAPLSVATRLVKICDAFEALTAPRPHRAALSPAHAYRILLAMNGHFDPRLLRRFVEVHGIHPVGTHVRLAGGERARVVGQSQRIDRPLVVLTHAADGTPLAPGPALDLSHPSQAERAVLGTLAPPDSDQLAA
ncbi:MAG TPA: HD domain-containing phosphohydrolase [Planctomycetota bacterium]|nr:HD domain-containing phosphohydrolase [Planctomycetota bacterium]